MFNANYNPDVLTCLANLSNDEVFTPPNVANKMLDLLPEELWMNKTAKFLDPCTKSGVFLREITKRLLDGLKDEIPDLQTRIDHILTKQVFGIGITELTTLLSRRSLYCTKNVNQQFSITDAFDNDDGNILYTNLKHKWKNLKCEYCGASKDLYNRQDYLEQHAYNFIHTKNPKELFNMKFDVIIGNPPYQLNDGSGKGAGAMPLYNKFVINAKKLNPRYISMIIPSRWFSGGRGLGQFRKEMIRDTKIKKIFDYENASDCFPNVEIKGGVCYFLWEDKFDGTCEFNNCSSGEVVSSQKRYLVEENLDFIIRYNDAISIVRKIRDLNSVNIESVLSSAKPFGFRTYFTGSNRGGEIKLYANQTIGYVEKEDIKVNYQWVNQHKVIVPYAVGSGNPKTDRLKPIYSEPGSCCSETYIVFGPFKSKKECENLISYMKTKFFHYLLTLKKNTQHATKKAYELVPFENLNEKWNDKKLYKKYNLSDKEIRIIEQTVGSID
jgi:site-specific DNA-methyltransferase (adenine-specific)